MCKIDVIEKISLTLSLGSMSTKNIGNEILVWWCLTLMTFLTVWPISSNAVLISVSEVVGCRFLMTTLIGLSDCS